MRSSSTIMTRMRSGSFMGLVSVAVLALVKHDHAPFRAAPHSPTPLSHPSTHPCRGERGSKQAELTFSLFSPEGWVEGWEKRAGVMRAGAIPQGPPRLAFLLDGAGAACEWRRADDPAGITV